MTELSREEIKDFARSEFESAMAFGVSLDNFVRLGMRCCKYGEESERAVSDRLLESLNSLICNPSSANIDYARKARDAANSHFADVEVRAMRKEKPE